MLRRVRVLRGVPIRRAVATQRRAALLTRAQMNPLCADLHTLLADPFLRFLNFSYSVDMSADFC